MAAIKIKTRQTAQQAIASAFERRSHQRLNCCMSAFSLTVIVDVPSSGSEEASSDLHRVLIALDGVRDAA
jgi:hypothetical protein